MSRRNDKQSKTTLTRRDFLVGAAGIGGAALGVEVFAPVVRAEMNAQVKIGCLISQSKVFAV